MAGAMAAMELRSRETARRGVSSKKLLIRAAALRSACQGVLGRPWWGLGRRAGAAIMCGSDRSCENVSASVH